MLSILVAFALTADAQALLDAGNSALDRGDCELQLGLARLASGDKKGAAGPLTKW